VPTGQRAPALVKRESKRPAKVPSLGFLGFRLEKLKGLPVGSPDGIEERGETVGRLDWNQIAVAEGLNASKWLRVPGRVRVIPWTLTREPPIASTSDAS